MKKQNITPLVLFYIISVLYAFPVLENISYWGTMDWDQFTFWNAVPRDTILRYHQFPLWNPYVNGGNPMLAHPDSPFLSPLYIFVLLFGPIIGMKIQIIVHIFIGLMGMFTLSKYLNLSDKASYLSSFIFMLNSTYALHLSEGHTEWMAMAFVPWAFLYFIKSLEQPRQALGAIFFLGLMIFCGVYIFSLFIVFLSVFAFFKVLGTRSIMPVKMLGLICIGTFLLCSIKLLPVLEYLNEYPRVFKEIYTSHTNLSSMPAFLFDRSQAQLDRQEHGFHEYGAYIGIAPFLLCLLGIYKGFKKNWPLILTGLISFVIVLGAASPIDLWGILQYFPVYDSLTVPSRNIFCVIFSLALVSGIGFSHLEQFISNKDFKRHGFWSKYISSLILLIVLVDLWAVSSPIFKNPFKIPPLEVVRNDSFRQRYEYVNLHKDFFLSHSSQYPVFLSNSGILKGYEIVNIKVKGVRSEDHPDYRGEVYLAKSQGSALMDYFSPNKIVVDVHAEKPDILAVNQNYFTGWHVRKNGKTISAKPFRGLISTPVEAGYQKIIFYYLPASFIFGFFVTGTFIAFVVIQWQRNK